MKRLLLIFSLLIAFIGIGIFLLLTTFDLTNAASANSAINMYQVSGKNLVSSPINRYYSDSQPTAQTLAAVGVSDSRPVIIDNFLSRNKSPMSGLGSTFVKIADKYGLDYRLLPAIAFQESTLGRNMPKGSHNAFGWAIYTGTNSGAKFHNWEFAIDTVAAGIKADYVNRGLNTVEAIMTRYTPDSDGSWAFGVNFAIEEMTPK